MTTFIMTGRYSTEAIKLISVERSAKANEIVEQCGGKIVAAYATMGETDLLAIMEFPDIHKAIKASVDLNMELGITFSSVPAIRIEEFDNLFGSMPYELAL